MLMCSKTGCAWVAQWVFGGRRAKARESPQSDGATTGDLHQMAQTTQGMPKQPVSSTLFSFIKKEVPKPKFVGVCTLLYYVCLYSESSRFAFQNHVLCVLGQSAELHGASRSTTRARPPWSKRFNMWRRNTVSHCWWSCCPCHKN